MNILLSRMDRQCIKNALNEATSVLQLVTSEQHRALPGIPIPRAVHELTDRMRKALARYDGDDTDAGWRIELPPGEAELVRAVVAEKRRRMAEETERKLKVVHDRAIADEIQGWLAPYDDVLDGALRLINAESMPRPDAALTVAGRHVVRKPRQLSPETLDPKHQVLLSASILEHDLEVLRAECDERGLAIGVAFADLDDFGVLNKKLGEVVVDRAVLPAILVAVEASTYGHGRAYRFGGDEFVVVMPNADVIVAGEVARAMKEAIEGVRLGEGVEQVSVSIGVWISFPNSHLTGRELIDRASQAKAAVKSSGKGRILIREEAGSVYMESLVRSRAQMLGSE